MQQYIPSVHRWYGRQGAPRRCAPAESAHIYRAGKKFFELCIESLQSLTDAEQLHGPVIIRSARDTVGVDFKYSF